MYILLLAAVFRVFLPPLFAQEQFQTRADQIDAARRAKLKTLAPDAPPAPERALNEIKERRLVERITGGIGGVRVRLGGLSTGQGFALGPEYIRSDLAGERLYFRASAIGSLKRAYLIDAEFGGPRLAGGKAFFDVYAVHRNQPQIQYYGPGPDSTKGGRSNYRLEDTGFIGQTGARPIPFTHLGVHGGYLLFNVGPGSDPRFAITQTIYSPSQAPGVDRQSNFLRGGGFLQIDYRDNPGGPRRGGNYLIRYSKYSDRSFSSYNFNQVELELQQYIPFVNERRVIALRGRANLTDAHEGNRVPFYLQPSVGGSNDLRGFRAWRFHDENSLILNTEYRWEVFSGMDMALFADAGKVFPEWGQLNFANLESSVGFGLRFNVRNSVFLRIDTGFSHEGFQIWFKFNNVF